jgi:GntR family transcriptional repressor for pyruvate dehydrogenase complex
MTCSSRSHARREGTSIEISRKLLDYLLSGGSARPAPGLGARLAGRWASPLRRREALKSLTLLGLLEVRLGDGNGVKR